MKYLILMLFVSACGNTITGNTVAGTPGKNGTDGTSITGAQGPAGATGVAGSNGTATYILQDVNGNPLPGILLSLDNNELWDETEGTLATYQDNGSSWGLQTGALYFTSVDCSGQAYSQTSNSDTNTQIVFANSGNAYVTTQSFSNGSSQLLQSALGSGASCSSISQTKTVYTVSAYSGAFPVLAPGPYTMVQQ